MRASVPADVMPVDGETGHAQDGIGVQCKT